MRRKFVEISPELLLDLVRGPLVIETRGLRVESSIPVGAKAVRCGISPYGNVLMVLESDTFPEVEEGDIVNLEVTLSSSEIGEPK